jgi:hypothetical protein
VLKLPYDGTGNPFRRILELSTKLLPVIVTCAPDGAERVERLEMAGTGLFTVNSAAAVAAEEEAGGYTSAEPRS